MAYRIRYDNKSTGADWKIRIWVTQLICAAGLFVVAAVSKEMNGPVWKWLQSRLMSESLTDMERATQTAAQIVASGDGWYQAAVVWCRMLLGLIPG